jgi:hypothetical protein
VDFARPIYRAKRRRRSQQADTVFIGELEMWRARLISVGRKGLFELSARRQELRPDANHDMRFTRIRDQCGTDRCAFSL